MRGCNEISPGLLKISATACQVLGLRFQSGNTLSLGAGLPMRSTADVGEIYDIPYLINI